MTTTTIVNCKEETLVESLAQEIWEARGRPERWEWCSVNWVDKAEECRTRAREAIRRALTREVPPQSVGLDLRLKEALVAGDHQ